MPYQSQLDKHMNSFERVSCKYNYAHTCLFVVTNIHEETNYLNQELISLGITSSTICITPLNNICPFLFNTSNYQYTLDQFTDSSTCHIDTNNRVMTNQLTYSGT